MVLTCMGKTLLAIQVTYVTRPSAAAVGSGGNTSDDVSRGPRVTVQESQPQPPGETLWPVLCA